MKALATPFDADTLSNFGLTHEDKCPAPDLLLPPFLGFEFGSKAFERYSYENKPMSPDAGELSEPESLDSMPSINSEDYEILDAVLAFLLSSERCVC